MACDAAAVAAAGRVSAWHPEDGWGVLESDQTPGGCWAHVSAVRTPSGFTELRPAQEVEFDWEPAMQDGYRFRAVSVWPRGRPPRDSPAAEGETSAYGSALVIDWDQPDNPGPDRRDEPGESR
ncbi:cold-shock protein [Actinomycetospora soli]|uniref:cold-shock protein n=1 Tax=Actinomycetospora soli TaxID=2893887 RepID=UPI001E2A85AE|nr:hypothetical protein [Actinomycetospora soli]MCD2190961.1 hypothetical protein [Actinomycetospora soli]